VEEVREGSEPWEEWDCIAEELGESLRFRSSSTEERLSISLRSTSRFKRDLDLGELESVL